MSATTVSEPSPKIVRKASRAGFFGTTVEAYDFIVFTYIIVYTGPLFFPGDDPAAAILSSLAVLGTGLLARPIGGLFFGWLGDKKGRKFTLVVTVVGMGVATFMMGLLPTYESIGILAPVLLVVFRLLQGLSAGGEMMGAATYVAEHATTKNHGFLNAMAPMGFALGTALGPGVVAVVTVILSEETMADWGWRVPLLLSLPLTLYTLYLRNNLEESPEFQQLAGQNRTRRAPVRAVFAGHAATLIKIIVISAVVLAIGYVMNAYLPLFLQQQVGLTPGTTAWIATLGNSGSIVMGFAAGFVTDRIGRRWTMMLILSLVGLGMIPIMFGMVTTGNLLLISIGQMLLAGGAGAAAVPAYATFTGMLPASVRYTGAALGFGVGSAIGGGLGPYLAAKLTAVSGSPYAAGFLVACFAVVGIAAIASTPNRGIAVDGVPARTGPEPVEDSPVGVPNRS